MYYPDSQNTVVTDTDDEQNQQYLQQRRIKRAKYTFSFLLAATGLIILGSQLGPLGISVLKGKILEYQIKTIKDPATAEEMTPQDNDLPYFDPGQSYFQNIIQHISPDYVAGANTGPGGTSVSKPVKIDREYSAEMKLSIPSVGIENIIVTPNVDSFNEEVYNASLKKGLAHFLGTAIPGDGGNSFIYGHSTVESFFSGHQNLPETIFTRLENVEIADKILIEKDGNILEYAVQKKKIIDPNDFDVLSGLPGKETVTLMTCWPMGIGKQRLIIIAERTNG